MSERGPQIAEPPPPETTLPHTDTLTDRQLRERIADAVPFELYVYDLVQDRKIYANRKPGGAWGYEQEEIDRGGKTFFAQLIHEDDRERVVDGMNERFALLKDGETTEIEYRIRRGDGQWRWVRTRDVIFSRKSDGSPKQILGTIHDVTEQKLAEQALAKHKRLLDLVTNAAPVVIYLYDLVANKT